MKITRRQLKQLLRKTILNESRLAKQQFYQKVRSRFPEVDDLFFVHWISGRRVKEMSEIARELDSKLDFFPKSGGQEFSANLVDLTGKNIGSHEEDWGPVGIVFQGIPTMASTTDTSTYGRKTQTGERLYPTALGQGERHSGVEDIDSFIDSKKFGYELDDIADPGARGGPVVDFSKDQPFKNISSNYPYQWDEWLVVPKRIIAVVVDDEDESIEEYGLDIDKIIEDVKKVCQKKEVSLIIGNSNISNFFKSLRFA